MIHSGGRRGEVFPAWEKHKGTEVWKGKIEELGSVVLELMLFYNVLILLCFARTINLKQRSFGRQI